MTLSFRVVTFNASLFRPESGGLYATLKSGEDPQPWEVAKLIRTVQPDLILINEFDFDAEGKSAQLFLDRYLNGPELSLPTTKLRHWFAPEVNTGLSSGMDLNQDGQSAGPEDAYGYGAFPGQYGMLLLSRFPLNLKDIRTFQTFLWKDLRAPRWPLREDGQTPYFLEPVRERLRLSSKTHMVVPVFLNPTQEILVVASHPTPPVFDGPEDRNGCRNADELQLLLDLLDNQPHLYDDRGIRGGIPHGLPLVILGDLNNDPLKGDGHHDVIRQLLAHPRLRSEPIPSWQDPQGNPQESTLHSEQHALRLDYVLPSRHFAIINAQIMHHSIGELHPELASDHCLVYLDLIYPASHAATP
jgi:hypothetical protein